MKHPVGRDPLMPPPDLRGLALPSCIGGLQTGCATDGQRIFTNGIDCIRLGATETRAMSIQPPTGGRTVASGKLVALDSATGALLREIELGPVWSGPSVSRGRVYVGTGNTLFNPEDFEAYIPKRNTGILHSFGLPGMDEVARRGEGDE